MQKTVYKVLAGNITVVLLVYLLGDKLFAAQNGATLGGYVPPSTKIHDIFSG